MKFLALQDLLILLDAEFKDNQAHLQPWDARRRQGSYVDLAGQIRVHGMRYYGSGTVAAVQTYAEALATLPKDGIDYTIFMAHAGVEGQLDDKAGGLSLRQWAPLRPYVDYLALGHFHKPFQLDDWIFNPGSPENCSIAEAEWKKRGYLVVETSPRDPEAGAETPRHRWELGSNPRRACVLYPFKVDHVTSPEDLLARLRDYLQRRSIELADEAARSKGCLLLPAVVELYLTGVLPFDRAALDLAAIEELMHQCFNPPPLVAMVKNLTRPAEYEVAADDTLTRGDMERQVLSNLFGRDARYAGQSDAWAEIAISLKQLALADGSPAAILDELDAHLDDLDARPEKTNHADSAS
jgi:DNA repair protein SbcD/Mre11